MDTHFPDIALNRPKADPRTVILNKWHFLESSSDHIPEYHKQPHKIRAASSIPISASSSLSSSSAAAAAAARATSKCDSLVCASTATSRLECQRSLLVSSSPAFINCLEAPSPSPAAAATAKPSSTSWSLNSSFHSTTLVNYSQSCHLYKESLFHSRFADSLKKFYKFQKTKFLLVLIFFYCAISLSSLPTTQAIPVRRTSTTGQRLILHSNVYRERYQSDQRQQNQNHNHNQYQHQYQQIQTRQQKNYHHHQQQRPVQRTTSYIAPILRRAQQHYRQQQQQLQHRHHLHQRAAPVAATANHQKMSYCENNKFFKNLSLQVNATLGYIKTMCNKYLKEREDKTYDEMKETWKLLKLEIRNPNRKTVSFENQLHQKMHDFYLNLHNFYQLAEIAHKDTTDNKTTIEHGEEIKISVILQLFTALKGEIIFNMNEAEKVLNSLAIEKPDVNENDVEFNKTMLRKVRDFLIVKEFIEEVEQVAEIINGLCEKSSDEQ